MKLVHWNCRGTKRLGFVDQARFYIKFLAMDVFCFLDTRLDLDGSK